MPVLSATAVPARTRIPIAPPLSSNTAAPPCSGNVDDATKDVNLAVTGADQPQQFAANAGGVAASRTDAMLAMRAGKTPLAATLRQIVAEGERMKADRATLAGEQASEKKELDGLRLGVRERWLGSWAGVLGGDAKQGAHGGDLQAGIAAHDDQIAKLDADIAAIPARLHDATAKQLLADGDATFKQLEKAANDAQSAYRAIADFVSLVDDAKSDVSHAQSAESWEQMDAMMKKPDSGMDLAEWNARSAVSTAQTSLSRVKSRAGEVERALTAWGKEADVKGVQTTDAGNSLAWFYDLMGSGIGEMFSSLMVSNNLRNAQSELDDVGAKASKIASAVKQKLDEANVSRAQYLEQAQARALDG